MFLAFHYGSELVFYLRWLWALRIHQNLFYTETKGEELNAFINVPVRGEVSPPPG